MIKVFEAFSGIGSQRKALENIGVEHEVVAISEIDKYAIKSYEAIYGNDIRNLGDISKIDLEDLPDFDLFTYSFPCQDISIAGNMRGFERGSNTRSSLLWDCERIIKYKKPKYLLLENVKNLVGKKFIDNFKEWLLILEKYGYTNYWQVLNARDYGIPQNRERVFVVSILGEHKPFIFPDKIGLKKRLVDFLEDNVEDKYYLRGEKADILISKLILENKIKETETCDLTINKPKIKDVGNCIIARYDCGILNQKSVGIGVVGINRLGGLYDNNTTHQAGSVYDKNGLSPTIQTYQGGNLEPIVVDNKNENYSLRKLTPKECWRLMGFTDEDFDKAEQVCSNTQLYKQAGNSIVVPVLENIFKNLFF